MQNKGTKLIAISLTCLLYLTGLIMFNGFHDTVVTARQFYLFGMVGIAVFALCLFSLLNKTYNKKQIRINKSDVFILLLFIYVTIRMLHTQHFNPGGYAFITFMCMIILYFFPRFVFGFKKDETAGRMFFNNIFLIFIISLVFIQVTLGFLQYVGILKSLNPNFSITGFFHNPGPYAIYLASFLPVIVYIVIKKETGNVLRYFSIVTLTVCILIIFLSKSRTAWLAGSVAVIYYLNYRYSVLTKIHQKFNNRLKRNTLYIFTIIIVATLAFGLFHFKKESVRGRLFIWKVSAQMIKDKPLFGFGFEQFQPQHNNYQAAYFKENPGNSDFYMVASDEPYAFNEFILISVEWGLTGLLLFVLILFSVFPVKKKYNNLEDKERDFYMAFQASILVIVISFLFSYSLHIIPIALNFFFFLGIVATGFSKKITDYYLGKKHVNIAVVTGIVLSGLFFFYVVKQIKANIEWKKAYALVSSGNRSLGLKLYQKIYPDLKHDKYFLYNYGVVLSNLGMIELGTELLKETEYQINDMDVNNLLGSVFEKREEYDKAIAYFEKASYMVPHRFYPKYRLVPLYYHIGEKHKSFVMANTITNMEVKVPSKRVDKMKEEVSEFMKKIK